MALFRRKTASTGRPTSGSSVGAATGRGSADPGAAAPPSAQARSGPEMYTGTVTEFEATAKLRINSAEDVDPNVKRFGLDGVFKGGGGGYGGAGTK